MSIVPATLISRSISVGTLRGARGTVHIEARTLHKQEGRHTLTQNLKAMGLWVLLIIRCSTFTVLSDVGHITHTCTQQQLALVFICIVYQAKGKKQPDILYLQQDLKEGREVLQVQHVP